MKRFFVRVSANTSPFDKAGTIKKPLESETQNYSISKSELENDTPENVLSLLDNQFGTAGNNMYVRQPLMSQYQQENDDWLQHLDALDGRRSHGLPSLSDVMES